MSFFHGTLLQAARQCSTMRVASRRKAAEMGLSRGTSQGSGEFLMSEIDRLLAEVVARIREAVQPERVILFGSRARGEARPESDFDLLVIKESDQPRYRRSAPLYTALADLPVEVEVVVYTPEEVREWSAVPEAFVTAALREGLVVYERES